MLRSAHVPRAILTGIAVSALLSATPVVFSITAPAVAQSRAAISIEFRTALTPYGAWRSVPRWGEVWVPAP
jgi:hypothetical protein